VKLVFDALLQLFRPDEFGGQNGQPGGNYNEGRPGKNEHENPGQQDATADNPDDHFLGCRLHSATNLPRPLGAASASGLIPQSGDLPASTT